MATLPPVRPEDQPLQDDVRRLGAMLGESITALSGPDAFADVELLRALCRQRRSGSVGPDSIVALLHGWDTPRAEAVVRAFSLYFRLINTAEQTHRVRRRHAWQKDDVPAQRGSLAETVSSLQAAGVAAGVARGFGELIRAEPHLAARGFWQDIDRPILGRHWQPTPTFRENARPYPIRTPAPTLGQSTRAVLSRILALSDTELDRLEAERIIGETPIPASERAPRSATQLRATLKGTS